MKTVFPRLGASCGIRLLASLMTLAALCLRADQIEMQNGDHYTGKVTTLDNDAVVLNSDILGTVRLRRDQVKNISFGAIAAPASEATSNKIPKPPTVAAITPHVSSSANRQVDLTASLPHQLVGSSNTVEQVRTEVLAGAGPKATQKFDELVAGISTGNVNVAQLRTQAATVAAQLRELRNSGEDDGTAEIFDDYLAILDSFVQQTKPAGAIPIAKPAAKPAVPTKTQPKASSEEDLQ